jgi:hypothetical protein
MVGVGTDLAAREKNLDPSWTEMLFLVILHYKLRERPAQAWIRAEPDPKIEVRLAQWEGHGQNFLDPK